MHYFIGLGWIFFLVVFFFCFALKDLDVTQELKVQAVPVPWQDVEKQEPKSGVR